MAGIHLISTAAAALLFLSSISSIPHTQARLPPMEYSGDDLTRNPHHKVFDAVSVAPLESVSPAFHRTPISASDAEVQGGDFRPTTPGHSPGAGHSLAPASHVDSKIH